MEFLFTEAGAYRVLYRIAALNSFLRSSQVYLRRTPTWMFYWKVAKNNPSYYFFQNTNRQVLWKIQTSICLKHILYRIAALNSFLRSSQVYLRRTPTWMFYWKVAKNNPSYYFFQNTNRQVLWKIQTSICLKHLWVPLNWWIRNCREMSNCVKVILMQNS